MASSDDEADYGPTSVSNYYFEDEADQPVPFSVLPIQWSEDESPIGAKKRISLRGTADKGLQTIHKDVTAWKFDLTNAIPVISVLSKEKKWIKLLKPRKSFEQTIRTILIVVHCLSYAKRFPEMSGKSLWEHLSRTFSLHEVRPSQNDLVDHIDLITEALKRDAILAKSKDVQTTVMSGFIVDDAEDVMNDVADEDKSNEVDDCFDSTCAFCDNGGNLLCCEGRCMRSFHPSEEDSEECQTECQTLGLTKEEVDAIHNFLCKNCEYKQHQCYACGKLGSSDKDKGAEVFSCVSATCGHFYHPFCISKLLFRDDEAAAEKLEKSIVEGGSFTCPLHKCYVCKGGEDKMKHELQFAVCRRCPKAYHRKCLPRKHEIIDELGTPSRDHIKFPCTEEDETVVEGFKRKQKPELPARKEKVESTKSSLTSKGFAQGKSATKRLARLPSAMKQGKTLKKIEKSSVVSDSKWKVKAAEASKNSLKKNLKSVSAGVDRPSMDDANEISLGERLFAYAQEAELTKLGKRDTPESELNKTATVTPARCVR